MLDSTEAAVRFNGTIVNSCIRAQTSQKGFGEDQFTVTIIGDGATGVSCRPGTFYDPRSCRATVLPISTRKKRSIVDAAPRLLPVLPEKVSAAVALELRKIDVEIHHQRKKVVEVSKRRENGQRQVHDGLVGVGCRHQGRISRQHIGGLKPTA